MDRVHTLVPGIAPAEAGSGMLKVDDLSFEVFDRPMHPEWFSSRAHVRLKRQDWICDVHLIPGGHVLNWSSGESRICEYVGILDQLHPGTGRLFQSRIGLENSTPNNLSQLLRYQACFEAEQVECVVFQHLYEEVLLDALRCGFAHKLGSQNRFLPPILSFLREEAAHRSLSVHSTHLFPEERAIVRVQSLFELA